MFYGDQIPKGVPIQKPILTSKSGSSGFTKKIASSAQLYKGKTGVASFSNA